MKIGIVSPYAYPRPGGANDHIRHTYEHLRHMGHDVRILTAPWGDDPPAQDVIQIGQAIAVPYNGSIGRITLSLRLEWLVSRILRRERFDVLHHHEPFVPFLSFQLLDSATCPHVATFHAFGGFSLSYWLGRPFLRPYWNRIDQKIAVSTAARHFISQYFPGDYEIVPNGVDVEAFQRARPFPEFRDGKVNILFVGRAEPRKGLLTLAQAYARLKSRHQNVRLIVCSSGPQIPAVRAYLRANRAGDVFFAGRVNEEDKRRFYKTADIFCAPSTGRESFGIVLLEAMAAGRAVVASDIHGYKSVVQRNISALLVEPKDADALAKGLETLVEHPEIRARMGEAGLVRATDFDWEHVTRRLAELYEEVVSRHGREGPPTRDTREPLPIDYGVS